MTDIESIIKNMPSIGKQIIDSEAFAIASKKKGEWSSRKFVTTIEYGAVQIFRANFLPEANWNNEIARSGRSVELLDLPRGFPVDKESYSHPEETIAEGNAIAKSEGSTLYEGRFEVTEKSVKMQTIDAYLPMSDEQLQETPAAQKYLDMRLPLTIREKVTVPVLKSLLDNNNIQTFPKPGSTTLIDTFFKVRTEIKEVSLMPADGILVSPDVMGKLLKEADPRGLPLITINNLPENTAFMGCFRACALLVSPDLEVSVANVDDKQNIKATLKLNVAVFRPSAFCKITDLNT